MLPTLLNNVGLAVINNKFGNRDYQGYIGVFSANDKLTAVISMASAYVMFALSASIPGWYGMKTNESSELLVLVLALAIIPEVLSVSIYQLIQARKKMWTSFFLVALPRDLMMVTLALVLIPTWDGVGLGVAYAFGWLLALVIIVTVVFRLKLYTKF